MIITEAIKKKMKEKGLTQKVVAEGVGISRQQVCNFLLNHKSLHSDTMQDIVNFVGLETQYGKAQLSEVVEKEIKQSKFSLTKLSHIVPFTRNGMTKYIERRGNVGSKDVERVLEYFNIELF